MIKANNYFTIIITLSLMIEKYNSFFRFLYISKLLPAYLQLFVVPGQLITHHIACKLYVVSMSSLFYVLLSINIGTSLVPHIDL